MINPKRLDAIRKLRNDASYGYATVTSQVYAKDVQELLDECDRLTVAYNGVAPELERQRARADLADCMAGKLRRILKSIADNELSVLEAVALTNWLPPSPQPANPEVQVLRGPMGTINAPGVSTDILEGGD